MTNTRPEPITPRQLHDSHRWIPLDEVALLPGNPNQGHTESLDASLNEFGWIDGIIIHQGIVIAGNHRVEHARIAGETGLPGYDLSHLDLDDARRMAIALAHNHTTRAGENDPTLLLAAAGLANGIVPEATGINDVLDAPLTADEVAGWADAFADVPDDDPDVGQWVFTVTEEQRSTIAEAIALADAGATVGNRNGHRLAAVCSYYIQAVRDG